MTFDDVFFSRTRAIRQIKIGTCHVKKIRQSVVGPPQPTMSVNELLSSPAFQPDASVDAENPINAHPPTDSAPERNVYRVSPATQEEIETFFAQDKIVTGMSGKKYSVLDLALYNFFCKTFVTYVYVGLRCYYSKRPLPSPREVMADGWVKKTVADFVKENILSMDASDLEQELKFYVTLTKYMYKLFDMCMDIAASTFQREGKDTTIKNVLKDVKQNAVAEELLNIEANAWFDNGEHRGSLFTKYPTDSLEVQTMLAETFRAIGLLTVDDDVIRIVRQERTEYAKHNSAISTYSLEPHRAWLVEAHKGILVHSVSKLPSTFAKDLVTESFQVVARFAQVLSDRDDSRLDVSHMVSYAINQLLIWRALYFVSMLYPEDEFVVDGYSRSEMATALFVVTTRLAETRALQNNPKSRPMFTKVSEEFAALAHTWMFGSRDVVGEETRAKAAASSTTDNHDSKQNGTDEEVNR